MAASENNSESMTILLSMLGQQPQLFQRHERVYQECLLKDMSENVGDQAMILADKQVL